MVNWSIGGWMELIVGVLWIIKDDNFRIRGWIFLIGLILCV